MPLKNMHVALLCGLFFTSGCVASSLFHSRKREEEKGRMVHPPRMSKREGKEHVFACFDEQGQKKCIKTGLNVCLEQDSSNTLMFSWTKKQQLREQSIERENRQRNRKANLQEKAKFYELRNGKLVLIGEKTVCNKKTACVVGGVECLYYDKIPEQVKEENFILSDFICYNCMQRTQRVTFVNYGNQCWVIEEYHEHMVH